MSYGLDKVYQELFESAYCINPVNKELFLLFFKPLITKYLEDEKTNYTIYISNMDDDLALYQKNWPCHSKLVYIVDDFVPTTLPKNTPLIYFYHRNYRPTIEDQIKLVEYLKAQPLMKYIYLGPVHKLLNFTRISLGRYYLHFQRTKSKWGSIYAGKCIDYRVRRRWGRLYNQQELKKQMATCPIFVYDFYVYYDQVLDHTKILKFNKQTYTPKKKIIANPGVPVPAPLVPIGLPKETKQPVKYIYVNKHQDTPFLLFPDGSKENYQKIVKQNKDIIEV